MNTARLRLVTLMVLTVLVLAGCPPPDEEPTATASPTPGTTQPGDEPDSGVNFSTTHLLVTGLANDIDAVLKEATQAGLVRFGDLQDTLPEDRIAIDPGSLYGNVRREELLKELFGASPQHEDGGDLTVARIEVGFPDNLKPGIVAMATGVLQVANASAALYAEGITALPVFAELELSISLGGAPPGPGITFDPNGVGAHPHTDFATSGITATAEFWEQWAFKVFPGINLFDTSRSTPNHLGCTVVSATKTFSPPVIVVFDTSAFVPRGRPDGMTVEHVTVPLASPCTAQLDIDAANFINAPSTRDPLKHHGLYAATLAYGMAPFAQIRLARVLDDTGDGRLSDLLRGLAAWYLKAAAASEKSENVVFNLSLGIDPPNVTLSDSELKDVLASLGMDEADLDSLTKAPPLAVDPMAAELPSDRWSPRVALEMLIKLTLHAGVVTVAAAGNDAGLQQYPAAYAGVIGVAASSQAATRACYSNSGDISAPGGDVLDAGGGCDPDLITRCTDPNCPYAVLSVIGVPGGYELAYWAGTSFAAPLVSGLVAQRFVLASKSTDLKAQVEDFVAQIKTVCGERIDGVCAADSAASPSFPAP